MIKTMKIMENIYCILAIYAGIRTYKTLQTWDKNHRKQLLDSNDLQTWAGNKHLMKLIS